MKSRSIDRVFSGDDIPRDKDLPIPKGVRIPINTKEGGSSNNFGGGEIESFTSSIIDRVYGKNFDNGSSGLSHNTEISTGHGGKANNKLAGLLSHPYITSDQYITGCVMSEGAAPRFTAFADERNMLLMRSAEGLSPELYAMITAVTEKFEQALQDFGFHAAPEYYFMEQRESLVKRAGGNVASEILRMNVSLAQQFVNERFGLEDADIMLLAEIETWKQEIFRQLKKIIFERIPILQGIHNQEIFLRKALGGNELPNDHILIEFGRLLDQIIEKKNEILDGFSQLVNEIFGTLIDLQNLQNQRHFLKNRLGESVLYEEVSGMPTGLKESLKKWHGEKTMTIDHVLIELSVATDQITRRYGEILADRILDSDGSLRSLREISFPEDKSPDQDFSDAANSMREQGEQVQSRHTPGVQQKKSRRKFSNWLMEKLHRTDDEAESI